MRPERVVAIVATLDTKGEEAVFLQNWFCRRGYDARLVDVGTLGDAPLAAREPDVSRRRVAAAAGISPEAFAGMRRDEIMAAMGRGAAAVLRRWHDDGVLAGVIGLGGNQGTAIACTAMRALPIGVPKVMLSTVASGNLRPYIGSSDIAVVFSVGDLLGGLNRVTRGVLVRAAGMLAGMMEAAEAPADGGSVPAVAITAFGNTHPAVSRIMKELRRHGYEVVPFHASGAGGSAMEALVAEGVFRGVIDLTTHELIGEVFGDDIYAPVQPGRLTVAGRMGIPQVVAPGGLEYFCFGPEESIPPRYRGRPTHYHNPYNTNVRATAGELARLGEELARRLNESRGPVAFLDPLRGWSQVGSPGGPLWDPEGNEVLRRALRRALRLDRVRYVEVDAAINDPVFADEVVRVFLELCTHPVTPSGTP